MLILASALLELGCRPASGNRIAPEYDKKTGRLTLLKYDANGDGKFDTWSHMDGTRVLSVEVDQDQNGTIDRWEYYDQGQRLERIGFSRAGDGKQDAWSYTAPDGSTARVESSTRRDGAVSRIEYYEKNALARAEEDTDGDGKMDKWETYEGSRLTSVAFDTRHGGKPDRRLVYGPDGTARVEVDTAGTGQFVPAMDPSAGSRRAEGH